jgi:hypothetical protein
MPTCGLAFELISKSSNSLIIKTFDNRTIFNENIKTDYFIRRIFEPDTIPTSGQEVYEAYVNKYVQLINEETGHGMENHLIWKSSSNS